MKKLYAFLGVVLIGALAWTAAGPDDVADVPVRRDVTRAIGAPPAPASAPVPNLSGEPLDAPPPEVANEPPVPPAVIAPIATETAPPPVIASEPSMRDADAPRAMILPVAGVDRTAIHDMFNDARGGRRHEAIDIMAPTGTPVIATDDGVVKKLFTSKPGGLTVYQFDPDQRFCYYYAHLDRYAAGLHEGQLLHRGEVLGYVGTTGNAPKNAPHLHFALIRLDKDRRWWKGTYVNPYPLLAQ
ncbi:MAG TPA: M23 family metallopeptidase [Thermoanaerobaculia bacterium]|nr:M23 family metallopeptidase [Thermoanaerobaculia bacterium]